MGIFDNLTDNIAIKSSKPELTREEMGIVSKLPQAKEGDTDALKELGIYKVHQPRDWTDALRQLHKDDDVVCAKEKALSDAGLLPEDWELYLNWKYELSIERIEVPAYLIEKYGPPTLYYLGDPLEDPLG